MDWPWSWDGDGWDFALTIFGTLLAVGATVQAGSAKRVAKRVERRLGHARFVGAAGRLEQRTSDLDTARGAGDSGTVLRAIAEWRKIASEVRGLAGHVPATSPGEVEDLRAAIASAQRMAGLSCERINGGGSVIESTTQLAKQAGLVMDAVRELQVTAEATEAAS